MERKSEIATANRIYDEFEPLSNWKTEQGYETLTIYLPGFKKEQLKVQVTTTRKLRVMGDRPAVANKWIRFRKEFPIPPNVEVDSISAKFEGANLVLRLPRLESISAKKSSPSDATTKLPPAPKESLKLPNPTDKAQPKEKEAEEAREEELTKGAKKEEALKVVENGKSCDGILNQDIRRKVNAYKENLGGYVALMNNQKTATATAMLLPLAALLFLSLGFYFGRMFTC